MESNDPALTTGEFGRRFLGFAPVTIMRMCVRYPGFGFRLHKTSHWRIPESHGHRLVAGETAAQIAANPSYGRQAA